MEYGGQTLCEMCFAVVDTGAPITTIPSGELQLLLQNPEIKDGGQGLLHVRPEDLPLVKDLKITLGRRVFIIPAKDLLASVSQHFLHYLILLEMRLSSEHISCQFQKPTYSIYGLSYIANYQGLEWTIGLSILRSFHTIFDDRLGQIGFSTNLFAMGVLSVAPMRRYPFKLTNSSSSSIRVAIDILPLIQPTVRFESCGLTVIIYQNDYRPVEKYRLAFPGGELLYKKLSAFVTVVVAAFDQQMLIIHGTNVTRHSHKRYIC
ncbi:hypothetical protein T265_01628 [Opisthorchis viverrini]|uniref:Uncharacterized protein n=1 Tax=Opisthorchis viverrini TaxID=6198 RepID=A0A074ZXN6_OPIVI|nr:hypothetical protein T265_01628 [Opisthorchis viverrini]KER32193.1 hypothetical protein T265_01628 [Opisthorchis viverrini]